MPVIGDRSRVAIATVIFATDFSPASEQAEAYARAFTKYFSSRIVLLDVVDLSFMLAAGSEGGAAMELNALEDASRIVLNEMEKKYTADGMRTDTAVLTALNPASEIVRAANNERADLIVMGTRGKGGIARIALGSTARDVMHLASCPVLTVGPAVKVSPSSGLSFRSIVFATDLSPAASQTAVLAFSFAQEFGAHIYLCHVLPNKSHTAAEERALEDGFSATLRRMIPEAVREWCEPACTLEHGAAVEGILWRAKSVNADLIVLGARKEAEWFSEFRAGVAYEVAAKASCPVLTMRG